MKKGTLLVIFLILFTLSVIGSVSATNVSFSDLDLITMQDVLIYDASTGIQLAATNTSATSVYVPSSELMLILKPTQLKRMEDPNQAFQDVAGFVITNLPSVLVIALLIALWWRGKK